MTNESSTKHLAALIHQKHDLLTRIKGMVQRQGESIGERKIVELMPLLTAKQKLLDELHAIEAKLNPFRDQDPETREWESEQTRLECAELVETNRTMLKAILEEEQRCERALQEQRSATREALDNHRNAEDAIRAYNQDEEPARNRLDLSSE